MQDQSVRTFSDRRRGSEDPATPVIERRQFANSHDELSPPARELGIAIDRYKLSNRRRFITYDEILYVIRSLGYEKRTELAIDEESTVNA